MESKLMYCFHTPFLFHMRRHSSWIYIPSSIYVHCEEKTPKEALQIHNTRDKKKIMMKRTYSSFAAYNCASSFGMLHGKKNQYGSFDK